MSIEQDTSIPIVFAADENYAMILSVAVVSLLRNAKEGTFYDIYVLIDESFTEDSMDKIKSYEESYSNCSFTFLPVFKEFDNLFLLERLSKVAFFRLKIPNLLPQYKKCLYLDADIIVLKDLSDLFATDLSEFYLAGALDLPAIADKRLSVLGFPDDSLYINSGVLLMNLDKIREDGIEQKFLEESKKNYEFQDQDVLNVSCCGKIKPLSSTYNVPASYFRMEYGQLNTYDIVKKMLTEQEINHLLRNKQIIHYLWKERPWEDRTVFLGEVWWIYRKYSPFP